MRYWLAKLRISSRLDSDAALSEAQRRSLAPSTDLRQFLDQAEALRPALRNATPSPEPPEGLHAAIMHAVHTAKSATAPTTQIRAPLSLFPRLCASCALLLFALAAGWWWNQHQSPPTPIGSNESLTAATEALDLGAQAARTMPIVVMAPLNDELSRLGQDLTNTAQFLLSSLP